VRCARLQFIENHVTNALRITAQMGIPKPERLDATRLQKRLSLDIMILLFRNSMLAAIHFNVQSRFHAKEIQIVNAQGVLTAEFVAVEAAGAQPIPDKFFRPGFLFAKAPSAFHMSHNGNYRLQVRGKDFFGSPSS
jgi:hypothetical protein